MMKMMLGLLAGACASALTAEIASAAIMDTIFSNSRTRTIAMGSSPSAELNPAPSIRLPSPAICEGRRPSSSDRAWHANARSLNPGQGLTAGEQSAKISETFFVFTWLDRRPGPCGRSFGRAMPKRAQTHDIVSRQGWLSYVPPPFRRGVLDRCKLQEYNDGATIYSVGDPPGGMYGLVRGSLGISIAPGERGPYVAHFAQPGTWFGDAAAFTEQP